MKTLPRFLFALTLVSLLFACSKSDNFGRNNLPANLKNSPVNGKVFVVSPNGTNDTQAILNAFASAKAAGPGAVVKLVDGNYYLDFIEIREFFGTFMGAGKGKTVITNLPDLTPYELIAQNKVPALLTFVGGDISVSDLSLMLTAGPAWISIIEMNMLQFSDFSADFAPATKRIRADLNHVEVTAPLDPNSNDAPYCSLNGVKFAPDVMKPAGNTLIPRSNIDITVSNSEFTNLWSGVYILGCKSGNFTFGKNGGNVFTGNRQGLVINENIGIQVNIMNNVFSIPSKLAIPGDPATEFYWDGLDINTLESQTFEYVHTGNMAFNIHNNTFNINGPEGIGIMDSWRYYHPDNPAWMQVHCENNTFNILSERWPYISNTIGLKDAVFSKNKMGGNNLVGVSLNTGLYWIPPWDPNSSLAVSENCKYLDNQLSNVVLFMGWNTQNYLVLGDVSAVFVMDAGINNKVIGLTHPGPVNPKLLDKLNDRMKKMQSVFERQRSPRLRAAQPCIAMEE